MLLRLGFDPRYALMPPPVDPVGQLVPPHGGPTMRATEWAVNGLAGFSDGLRIATVWAVRSRRPGPKVSRSSSLAQDCAEKRAISRMRKRQRQCTLKAHPA
jgi:hypothetical protein